MLTFILVLLVLYCTTLWILPKAIAWFIKRKLRVVIRIGGIGICCLKLYNVHIVNKGFTIRIDEIGIKSRIFNTKITKLIVLVVKHVRIKKDFVDGALDSNDIQPVDFRDKKVPPFINTFAQFMAVHVYNVSIMLLRSQSPMWSICANAKELHLDGNIVQNACKLIVNVTLSEACVELLRRPGMKANEHAYLAQLNFAIVMEATLVAKGPLSVEKLYVSTTKIGATINDGLYRLIEETKQNTDTATNSCEDYYNRILPIVPKNLVCKMKNTLVCSLYRNRAPKLVLSLKSLTIYSGIKTFISAVGAVESISEITSLLQMRNLHISINKEDLLVLKVLELDAKLKKSIASLYLNSSGLQMTYNHALIRRWILSKNYFQNALQCKKTSNDGSQKLLEGLVLNVGVEFRQVSFVVNLYGKKSYVGLTYLHLVLPQSVDTRVLVNRHWKIEVRMDSLIWYFRDCKQFHIRFKWGLLRFCTYGTVIKKVKTELEALQLVWNTDLVEYMRFIFMCFGEYNIQGTAEPKNHSVAFNLTLSRFNFTNQNREGECLMLHFNLIEVENNAPNTVAHLDNVKLSLKGDSKFVISTAKVSYDKRASKLSVVFLEKIIIQMSEELDEKILTFLKEMAVVITAFKENCLINKKENRGAVLTWELQISGTCRYYGGNTENDALKVSLDHLHFKKRNNVAWLSYSAVALSIGDMNLYTIPMFKAPNILDVDLIRRAVEVEGMQFPWNDNLQFLIDMSKSIGSSFETLTQNVSSLWNNLRM